MMFINRLADFLSHPVFQIIAFVCALVAGIVTFASHSLTLREKLRQLSSNRVRRPKARYKVVKSFAIVLNGPADYAPQIRNGFVHTLEQLLKNSRFAPVFEEVVGAAEGNSSAINEQRFDQLLARFPGRTPDYLVTIGSQVSIFAHQKYLNKLPLVFIGVGSPQKSGLLPADDNDRSNRGNIAGVMYGLDTKARMEFLSNLVTPEAGRRYRIGFICNRDYSQDCHVAEQVQAIAAANFENAHV
ncbi:MAG TPA: hypothetical protein VHF69_06800, partial [Candidatus Synoicihabitans sp.]|nr:hypothetical protein [Candidatus Synoicihabitans sp.]